MTKLEKLRKEYKSWGRWYYHLVLDSLGDRNLFNDRDEYVNGMNVVAIGQFINRIGVIQFDWMRNHGHFVLLATGLECCRFFSLAGQMVFQTDPSRINERAGQCGVIFRAKLL